MPRAVHRFLLQRTSVTRREAPPCGKHYPPFDSQRRQGDSGGRHTRSTAMVDTELVIMFTQRTNVQRRWWCCLSTMQRLRWEGWWLSSGCATQVYDSLILFTPGGNILYVDTSLYDVFICKKKTVFKDICVMCVWERDRETNRKIRLLHENKVIKTRIILKPIIKWPTFNNGTHIPEGHRPYAPTPSHSSLQKYSKQVFISRS